MSKRSQAVFQTLLESPDSSPRAVIESKVNEDEEEMVECPDCGTEFPKDTGYCPECEEKKGIDESVQAIGELTEYKVQDFRDRLVSEFGFYDDTVEYANFQLNEVRNKRINDYPASIFEVRVSETIQPDEEGTPPAETYYILLMYDRENNKVMTRVRRAGPSSGQQVNDQTTFYSIGVYDFDEQYMRSLVSRVIDDMNVDFYENVA